MDALSQTQQARLGQTLARADLDARSAINRMDQAQLDDLTRLDVSARTRARLAPRYADLDATRRGQLNSVIETTPEAGANAARLDTEGIRDALDFYCTGGVSGGAGAARIGSAVGTSLSRAGCSLQTDLGSAMWRVDADVRDSLRSRLDPEDYGRLVDSDIDTNALKAVDNFDSVSAVRRTDGAIEIEGTQHGIDDVTISSPDDGTDFYQSRTDTSIEKLKEKSPQELGQGEIEADLAPKLIEERDGWEVIFGKQVPGSKDGIDLVAKKPNGDYVITEVKYTSVNKPAGKRSLTSTRQTPQGDAQQMEDDWIRDAFREETDPEDMDVSGEYDDLDAAITTNNYEKEVLVVQDSAASRAISDDLADVGIDTVNVVRTADVLK